MLIAERQAIFEKRLMALCIPCSEIIVTAHMASWHHDIMTPLRRLSKSLPKGACTLITTWESAHDEKHERTDQNCRGAGIRLFITTWGNLGRGSLSDNFKRRVGFQQAAMVK